MTGWFSRRRSGYLFWGSILGYLLTIFIMAHLGHIGKHVLLFSFLYALSFLFLLGLWRTFPEHWSTQAQMVLVFCLAITARLAIFSFSPCDDINRYIWEGHIMNQGFNPYIHAPNDPMLAPHVIEIWQGIAHKDLSSPYPPLSVLIFRGAALFSANPAFFKTIILFFDIATVGLLAVMIRNRGLPFSRLVLYALNPLVLVFVAGEGHLDSIQVFFVCLSLLLLSIRREGWGFFALGLAAMAKYFAVILTPFLINAENWKKSLFLLGALLVCALPFWSTWSHFFTTLVPFGTTMHYNDSLMDLFRVLVGPGAVWMSGVFLVLCLLAIYMTIHDPLRSSFWAMGCLLLFLGTLHPWYLVVITPFLVFFPSRAWLYLHFAVVFTFPVIQLDYATGVFQEIRWLKLFEYVPFYGLLFWDGFTHRWSLSSGSFETVRHISVVIPVLDESENIGPCLNALRTEKGILDITVVDGGSTDGTPEIARHSGARVITAGRGRGGQIRAGIDHGRGDVVLVLHADCFVREGISHCILRELNGRPRCMGGATGMEFRSGTKGQWFVAQLNNLRARWTGISFGDQAQFIRKEALPLIGGFPALMLMEDVELAMRMKEKGEICFIPRGVTVSNRRWKLLGFWINARQVLWTCFLFLLQRRLYGTEESGRKLYEQYYSAP
jgi:hypothetical protein